MAVGENRKNKLISRICDFDHIQGAVKRRIIPRNWAGYCYSVGGNDEYAPHGVFYPDFVRFGSRRVACCGHDVELGAVTFQPARIMYGSGREYAASRAVFVAALLKISNYK